VAQAAPDARAAFLRKVAGLTFVGLGITGVSALAWAGVLMVAPFLSSGFVPLVLVMGSFFGAQAIGRLVVSSRSTPVALGGFVAGTALEGVAFGYLLLIAAVQAIEVFGNPFVFLLQGVGLVSLAVAGMTLWLLTGPKNLSWIGGLLSTLTLPMLGLMVISVVFPVGILGVLMSAAFVVISALGLLYTLQKVVREVSTDDWIQASYALALGLLALYWNLVTLLMRLQRR
jgi:FtsH-binding integral membrane protein